MEPSIPPEDGKNAEMLDAEFAFQLEQVDEASGKRTAQEGAEAFQKLAKAQRTMGKGKNSDKNNE